MIYHAATDEEDCSTKPFDGLGMIAVVGLACRFAGAPDAQSFWRLLLEGREGLRVMSDSDLRAAGLPDQDLRQPGRVKVSGAVEDALSFDSQFFGYSPEEAALLDPQHRLFLESCWHALADAGSYHSPNELRIGVYGGVAFNTYLLTHLAEITRTAQGPERWRVGIANDKDTAISRVAYKLGLTGPALGVQTACSSSLVAVHMACQSILCGDCDMALAGGASVHFPQNQGYLHHAEGIESRDGHCRPFSSEASGTVFSDGVGVVVLRRYEDAVAAGDRIYACILGSAINNDAADKIGFTAPSVSGQAAVIGTAHAVAGIRPAQVVYVEAHGTGTVVGDAIELKALTQAFGGSYGRQGPCLIGAVKSNIGHADTAAGIAGLIKTSLCLYHDMLAPTLHVDSAPSRLPGALFALCSAVQTWPTASHPPIAGISSFGIGGTNAHVIVQQAHTFKSRPPSRREAQLIPLWGPDQEALQRQADQAIACFEPVDADWPALAQAFQQRPARGALRSALLIGPGTGRAFCHHRIDAARPVTEATSPAWLFPGQGSQVVGMAAAHYRASPHFAQCVDGLLALLDADEAVLCRATLLQTPDDQATAADLESLVNRCAYTHLVLFIHAYALAAHYRHLGVEPRALLGHSLGELIAAAVAGVWTPADALALVRLRGRLLERTPSAAMMAVQADRDLRSFSYPPGVTLACINGPRQFVLSGAEEALEALLVQWPQWHAVRLRGDHAFHSPMVEPAFAPFLDFLRGLQFQAPQFPLLSCVSGTWTTPEQACSPLYWAEHLLRPVRFAEAAQILQGKGTGVYQEIGHGKTLIGLMARQAAEGPLRVVASCTSEDELKIADPGCLRPVAELWLAGVDIHWPSLHASVPQRGPVPPYPFARQRLVYLPPDQRLPTPEAAAFPAYLQRVAWTQAVQRRGPMRLSLLLMVTLAPLPVETLQWLSGEAEQVEVWTHAAVGSSPPPPSGPQKRSFDFTQAGQWQSALAALPEAGVPGMICYVDQLSPDALDFETSLRCSLGFARALGLRLIQSQEAGSHTVHWLSRNLFALNGSIPAPDRQALWGVARVLPQEVAGVRSRVHDIEGGHGAIDAASLTAALRGCLCSVPDTDAADFSAQAWRRGQIWLPRVEDVTGLLQSAESAPPVIRHQGSYLITGGAGGAGRLIAAWLSDSHQAHVLLCGRRPQAELHDWDAFVAAHPNVGYTQADVTDEAQMARLGPGLHGVFHCAGLAGEGLIAVKTDADAQAVCAPKVSGTRAILRAYASVPLDFMVLFSSVNAWFGGLGQAEYAGANAYMEAQANRCDAPWRLIAMAWDSWTQTGMAYRRYGSHGRLPDSKPGTRLELTLPGQHWLFAEHQVDGVPLLPGMASLALLLRAAPPQSPGLRKLAWLRPVRMPAQSELLLQVHSEPDAAGTRLELLADGRIVCTVLAAPPAPSANVAPPAAGALRDAFKLEESEALHVPPSPRLQLGPRWDCMAELRIGGGCYRLELRRQAVAPDFGEWPWHPALVDVALLPLQLCARALSVPASIDQVWAAPSLESVRFSYVRIRERGTDHVLADVCLVDENGDPRLWLDGMRFAVLPEGAIMASALPENPRQLQGLSNDAALWALERTLQACDLPTITIGSQEPRALQKRLDGIAQKRRPGSEGGGNRSAPVHMAPAPGASALQHFCALIAAQLGYASVEPGANYFALGGDSLSGLQLISGARELGLSLSLASLYRTATVADLFDQASAETAKSIRVPPFALVAEDDRQRLPAEVIDAFPLSALQQGIEYYRSRYEGQDIYRDLLWADLQGRLEPELMAQAWSQCVQRHEVLRTEIDNQHFSVALQLVRRSAELSVDVQHLEGRSVEQWVRDSRLKQRADHGAAARPFVLLGKSVFHVLLLLDDALLDGWSATSLLAELLGHYAALLEGRPLQTQPLALSFHDYVSHEQTVSRDPELLNFWRQTLNACVPSRLVETSGAGQRERNHAPPSLRICIERAGTFDTDLVERIATAHGCAPKIVFLAAYLRCLSLFCGAQEVTTGLETHTRLEVDDGAYVLGLHLNTLPMRYRFRPMPLSRYLASVAECESALMAHRHLPLSAIQQDWDVPLFDNCFNYTHFRGLHQTAMGNTLQLLGYHGEERTHYPFKLWVDREAAQAGYALYLAFDAERLLPEQAQTIAALFINVLTALDGPTERCVSVLGGLRPMAPALAQPVQGADAVDVVELFDAACQSHAQLVALHHADSTHSYAQLARAVQQAAARLSEEHLAPDDIVAVLLPRSFVWVASVWAILKINATMLLLDTQAPRGRTLAMLQSAEVRLLICEPDMAAALTAQGSPVRTLPPRELFVTKNAKDVQPAPSALLASSPAYLIFTSGSTGKSKAVIGTRLGLSNRVRWQLERYPMGPGDLGLLRTASAFVDVFWELLGPLCAGAGLVVADDSDQRDSSRLLSLTHQHRITHWVLVPTLLEELLQHLEPDRPPLSLRQVSVSGELLRPALIARAQTVLPQVRWINLYGSSEVAADVAAFAVEGILAAEIVAAPSMPIGNPISQTGLHLLDERLLPVEPGQQGELYVSGASLAHGYLRQAALSAERFLPNPWATSAHDCRLFRTGDLAIHGRHGLEIVGRLDRQIKQRGVRIDLDDLEARLLHLPGVERCAVERQADGLLVYLQCAPRCDLNALWPAMRDSLLAQERPGQVRLLDKMPLTASGKINRMVLQDAAHTRLELHGSPLQGEQQMQLAALWRELLPDTPVIFAESRFDELGGHSLLLMQLARLIERRLSVRLGVAAMLAAPSLQEQAALLGDAALDTTVAAPALSPEPTHWDRPFKPTALQQGYWVLRHAAKEKAASGSHLYQEWLIPGLDTPRLSMAWNRLIDRHHLLRAVFGEDGLIRIEKPQTYELRETDLRTQAPDVFLQAHRERQRKQPLDPRHWPLFDLQVFRLSDEQALFTVKLDFLIVDAWSAAILARELWALYRNLEASLPNIDISFRDVQEYIERDHSSTGSRAAAQAYWTQRLAQLQAAPELPLRQGANAVTSGEVLRREHILDARARQRLAVLAKALELSLSSLMLAAYASVLQRWSCQKAFTLTLTLFDRPPLHPHVNRLVGDFTTVLLLEVADVHARDFFAFARVLHAQLLRDLDHRQYSGIEVARTLNQQSGGLDAMRYVYTSIVQAEDAGALAFPQGSVQTLRMTRTAGVWIDNQVVGEGDGLRLHWDCLDAAFPDGMVADMFASYCALVDKLVESTASDTPAVQLPLAQRQRRQVKQPAPTAPIEDYMAVIAKRCAEHGGATAVIAADRELSYRQLWWEASRLSTRIRQGGGSAECVAVQLHPGWRQVVAVLAIQLAGLPYVPLSMRWPAARREQVMREHGIRHLVTQDDLARPAIDGLVVFDLADGNAPVPNDFQVRLPPNHDEGALAYIIFTSGSTGSPKGVMMERRAVQNTLNDLCDRLRMGPSDRVLGLSDLAFDLSVFDIFGVLMTGGALILPGPSVQLDPRAWWQLCQRHGVTIWNSVPAVFELLADYAAGKTERLGTLPLRWVMFSGDWIPLQLPPLVTSLAPRARLLSLGGATEAGIWSVSYPVPKVRPEWRSIPYGLPLSHQSCKVVDAAGLSCPEWVVGELLIGGHSLSSGYWHQPELSAAAFGPDVETGERHYRTGDLARYRGDGVLELIGRNDTQVKVSGHRVECMEVEHVVASFPGVRRAAVLAIKGRRGHELHAVVEAPLSLDAAEIQAFCRTRLPDWMQPRQWHQDIGFALNDNGKIDRRSLHTRLQAKLQLASN